MGIVYVALDTLLDKEVAIKVMNAKASKKLENVRRFEREAKAAASLMHPNVVETYDYISEKETHFIVSRLIKGVDLYRYLHVRGVLDIDRTVIIAHDIARGLGYVHQKGIVHRDIKPQNVLIGQGGTIQITDFGIATFYKDIDATQLTKSEEIIGTVAYIAPEQARKKMVSPASDIYSLGIVMYEMLTGQRPFEGSSALAILVQHIEKTPLPPSSINPNIPAPVEALIMRCLEKSPEKRFSSGDVLADEIENLYEEGSSKEEAIKKIFSLFFKRSRKK